MRKFLTLLITTVLLLTACTKTTDTNTLPVQSDDVVTCLPEESVIEVENPTTDAITENYEIIVGQTIYVDGISGDDLNDGTHASPYKTINQAASRMMPGDTLIVKDGVYRETASFVSGLKEGPITVKAAEGAQPIISGADIIEAEWSEYSDNIYVASVSDEVTDLFVDGVQMNLARWPNAPVGDLLHMERALTKTGTDCNQIVDPNLPAVDLTGARVNMVPGEEYTAFSRIITFCEPGKIIAFDEPVKSDGDDPEGFDPFVPHMGNKYYVLDSLALLDAPGEWFYDRNDGKLYLYTENGDSPANYEISHRTRKHGIDISASEYVHISGIDLIACAVDGGEARYCILDDVNVTYGEYFIDGNGYDSMYTKRANHLGGEGNVWQNSKISKSAGSGIFLTGKNNTVNNCNISDVNWSAGYLANVSIEGEGNTVKNCTLSDSGRFIIYHSTSVQTKILNNDISGASALTFDCGAVYAWGTDADGTEIAYNYVHDNKCIGIYLDNNCSGINVHHNIIAKNNQGLQLNSQMLNCAIVNNTIVNNNKLQESFCYASDTPSMAGSVVANNLYSGAWALAGGDNAPTVTNNQRSYGLPNDFKLPAEHEAIDAGVILPPYTDGYEGAAPDVGAFESSAAAFQFGSTIK